MTWDYNTMTAAFDSILSKWEFFCATGGTENPKCSPHPDRKDFTFNPSHLAFGEFCESCYSSFQDEWNTLLVQNDPSINIFKDTDGKWKSR